MKETRTYHHGNLRQQLIDVALQAIEGNGYQALSLRDLAQAVGVTRAAPYRHFVDRDALLRACALEGFRHLLAAHQEKMQGSASAQEKVRQLCQAFLNFSAERPQLFMLMYDSGLLQQAEEDDELGSLLRGLYEDVAKSLAAALQEHDEGKLKARMIAMWSTLYGYARLRQSRMLKPYMVEPLSREQAEAAVIAAAIGPFPG
jgi:AcrR family transcriptional regulator